MKKLIISVLLLLVLSSNAFAQSAPISNNYSKAQVDHFFATYPYVDSVSVYLRQITTDLQNQINLKPSKPYVDITAETTLAALASMSTKLDNVENIATKLSSSTLITGGMLTQIDNTHFQIDAGTAYLVDNYSDQERGEYHFIAFDTFENILVPYIADCNTTYIGIDKDKVLQYFEEFPTPIQRRQVAIIGWVDHADRATINGMKNQPYEGRSLSAQMNDFFSSFGPFNVDGNQYLPLSGLQIIRSAGHTFDANANWDVDYRSPHIITTEIENPASIWYSTRDGSGGWNNDLPNVDYIDPNHWDDGSGTLKDVPTGAWTVQTASFYAQWLGNDFQYGQDTYETQALAVANVKKQITLNPYNTAWDTYRGWIVVKQGATDLAATTQAVFISAGKLGLSETQSSSSAVAGEVNTASNYGTHGYGLYDSKSGVNLYFKNLFPLSGKLSMIYNNTTHCVDMDVVTGQTSSTVCAGNDARIPTQDQRNALIGSYGTPSSANPYVTTSDPRIASGTGSKAFIEHIFYNRTVPYMLYTRTERQTIATMYFPGPEYNGVPKFVKVISMCPMEGGKHHFQIIDITHDVEIANFPLTDDRRINITEFELRAEIPKLPAMWEIRLDLSECSPENAPTQISSVAIEF